MVRPRHRDSAGEVWGVGPTVKFLMWAVLTPPIGALALVGPHVYSCSQLWFLAHGAGILPVWMLMSFLRDVNLWCVICDWKMPSRGDKPDMILSESEVSCDPLYLRETVATRPEVGVAFDGVTLGSKEPLGYAVPFVFPRGRETWQAGKPLWGETRACIELWWHRTLMTTSVSKLSHFDLAVWCSLEWSW